MARCGCASNVCTCTITGGTGVQVSGTGTPTDPYILGAQPTVLTVADSASVDLTLTGNGSTDAPYLLRADLTDTPGGGGGSTPVGSIMDYAGDSAPPGWKICDGSAIARVEFSGLFAVISTKYGAGDGVDTFNLPDLRSRVTVGAQFGARPLDAGLSARTLATKGGLQDAVLPSHNHPLAADSGHAHGDYIADGAGGHIHQTYLNDKTVLDGPFASHTTGVVRQYSAAPGDGTTGAGSHNHAITAVAAGSHSHGITGAGVSPTDQNMPPYVVLNKIIKT